MGCFESRETRHEPTAVRGCTDICWLVIYVIFWFALLIVAIFSFVYGNPIRIIHGYDSFGNTCGVTSNEKYADFPLSGMNTIDKPYLLFLDVKHLRKTLKICVKSCPDYTIANPSSLYDFYKKTNSKLCKYDFNMTDLYKLTNQEKNPLYFGTLGPCPSFPIYQSKSVLHRCIPTAEEAPGQYVREMYGILNRWGAAEQFIADLYKTWPIILGFLGGALILSIIMISMLHWLTKIISWLICIFVGLASIAITILLWMTYYKQKHNIDMDKKLSLLEEVVTNEKAIYILAIIATIVMILLIVIIILLRKKIGGLAALFEEAGKCMLSVPGLAGPPILAVIALIIFFTFWLAVVIGLATANYPGVTSLIEKATLKDLPPDSTTTSFKNLINTTEETKYDKTFQLVEYTEAKWIKRMLWLYFIGLIWTSEFIFACQQLAIAGAVAFWYFRKPTDTPVLTAISKLVKYHLGSVAKGAFLITLFKVPRLILTYIYAKLKRSEDSGNSCATCGLKSCICCFYLLEKFMRYLNHNAYTVIAIESINFCPAAGVAWNALWSNALQVATINGIGDFILFLAKVAVAAVCGLISIILLRDNPEVNFYMAPVIIITIFSFCVAHVVLSLYEIVVDTLFLCVCEDRTINGPNGRWKESNLAMLLGEEPAVEQPIQQMEMTPITKQPFSSHNIAPQNDT